MAIRGEICGGERSRIVVQMATNELTGISEEHLFNTDAALSSSFR